MFYDSIYLFYYYLNLLKNSFVIVAFGFAVYILN